LAQVATEKMEEMTVTTNDLTVPGWGEVLYQFPKLSLLVFWVLSILL
jgi:hypothetical protein